MKIDWLKRIAAMLAVTISIVSISGCTDSETGISEGNSDSSMSEVQEEPLPKIGYIFKDEVDLGWLSTDVNNNRLAAAKYAKVESYYIDNVNITDFPEAVKVLKGIGCEYIVSGSWQYNNMLNDVAGKNMNLNFISHGARIRTANAAAYTDQVYEAAYVAGMVAAFNSETEKVGIVVDPSMLYTTAYINAAALGSQLVYHDAEMVVAYAAQNGEIHKAVDALIKKNCDVIISYTASPETVEYCNSKGIKVIGNLDYRETAENYKNMIMYCYVDHSSYFLAQSKMIQLDSWQPETYVGTLMNGVVNVSDALAGAKEGTADIISALVPKVAGGQAPIFAGELKDAAGNVVKLQGEVMQASEIYSMNWYVKGVNSELETFVVPITDIGTGDFDIES